MPWEPKPEPSSSALRQLNTVTRVRLRESGTVMVINADDYNPEIHEALPTEPRQAEIQNAFGDGPAGNRPDNRPSRGTSRIAQPVVDLRSL